MKEGNLEYRKNLADKLREIKKIDPSIAEQHLEKVEKTDEYKGAKSEKVIEHKKGVTKKNKEKQIAQLQKELQELEVSVPTEEKPKVESKEEEVKSPDKKLLGTFAKVELVFSNEKEFGTDGKKAVEKVNEIMKTFTKFMDALKEDYMKENMKSGISPEEYMSKIGLRSNEVKNSSPKRRNVETFSLDQAKKDFGKRKGEYVPIDGLFLNISNRYESKRQTRTIGKWKDADIKEEWFTPKQENRLYQQLTGNEKLEPKDYAMDDNVEIRFSFARDKDYNFNTKIPGVSLDVFNFSNLDKSGSAVFSKTLFEKIAGFKRSRASLNLDVNFIKNVLEGAYR